MKQKPLKIGFDLDGVILYNPARIVRPLISQFKRLVLKKKKTSFYVPKSRAEEIMWELFHKSSIFIAPGFKQVKQLVAQNRIEAYLITGRYDHLKQDLDRWLHKINAGHIFKGVYHNAQNQQPHLFKEAMIRKLNLDYFIEDNWDIVNHLHLAKQQRRLKTTPIWIFNLFDRKKPYPFKYPHLHKAIHDLFTRA